MFHESSRMDMYSTFGVVVGAMDIHDYGKFTIVVFCLCIISLFKLGSLNSRYFFGPSAHAYCLYLNDNIAQQGQIQGERLLASYRFYHVTTYVHMQISQISIWGFIMLCIGPGEKNRAFYFPFSFFPSFLFGNWRRGQFILLYTLLSKLLFYYFIILVKSDP